MKTKDKVVSLETAKRLKEAGFPQNTERCWVEKFPIFVDDDVLVTFQEARQRLTTSMLSDEAQKLVKLIAAPDATEIGELLGTWLTCIKIDAITDVGVHFYLESKDGYTILVEDAVNESEARAAAWLWLKENKLI